MQDDDPIPPNWQKVCTSLRDAGVAQRPDEEDLSAPHGFATRVVARTQADRRADSAGLLRWRRWSLAGAACALLLFGGSFLVIPNQPPAEHLLPLPTFEEPAPPNQR